MVPVNFYANNELNSLDAPQIREYQEARMRVQLAYCYNNSPFYKTKFREAGAKPEDIKTLDDLRQLPVFMNKDQERKNAEESLRNYQHPFGTHLCAPLDELFLTGTTSGTTGMPTFTYTFTKNDVDLIARALGHRFAFNGLKKGDRILFIFALGIYATTMSLWGIRSIGALPIDIDARAGSDLMLRFADLTKPRYMATTVSLSEYLIGKAPSIIGKEVGELNLQGLFLTGEVGVSIPEVRERIETAYGCPVYDYWAPAGHAIAITCGSKEYSGMHGIAPDLCTSFDDLVDPETKKPVHMENGAVGEIVMTSLKREAAPLVKYGTGDIVQLFTEPCPHCGFPGKRIKLIGRADDMLVVKGVNIYPSAIKQVVQSFVPRVTGELRVVLTAPPPRVVPPLRLKLERGVDTRDPDLEPLAQEIAKATHDQLKIRPEIEWVESGSLEKSTRKTPVFEKKY
jgi:phenylacetate-CoA ligase